MDTELRIKILEEALEQMLRPVKNIPLNIVIKSLSGHSVVKFKNGDKDDEKMMKDLLKAINECAVTVRKNPIIRPRPNEVGNDIEEFVFDALTKNGLKAQMPSSANGKAKTTGYPDILFYDHKNRPTYLECKIFGHDKEATTMRSFYLSPSETFKVTQDARHLLLAFGMSNTPINGTRNSKYVPETFKLVDLHDLLCDVKYEFNSDNKRLYANGLVLRQGSF